MCLPRCCKTRTLSAIAGSELLLLYELLDGED